MTLRSGTFALWDSTRAIDFLVPDGLQKITLMLPQTTLDAVLPGARDLTGTPICARSGSGALFATHLRSLVRQGGELPAAQHESVLHATIELMATALDTIVASAVADHRRKLMARSAGISRRTWPTRP